MCCKSMRWKKRLLTLLAAAGMLVFSACQPSNSPSSVTSSTKNTASTEKTTSTDATGSVDIGTETTITTTTGSSTMITTTTAVDDGYTRVTGEGTRATESTTQSTDGQTTTSNGVLSPQRDFVVSLINYHPGIPGYDLEYMLKAEYRDKLLNLEEYSLSVNLKGVVIQDNCVRIPENVRNQNKPLIIQAVYTQDPSYTYQLTLEFKQWVKTFEDNFDSLNRDVWKASDGFNRDEYIMANAANIQVKDGKMVLEPKKESYKGYEYTFAEISSIDSFYQLYGCFTSRVKMPEKGGILSSFWLLPQGRYRYDNFYVRTDTDTPWRCSEIDIVEHWATSGSKIHIGEHYWDEQGNYLDAVSHKYDIPDFRAGEYYEYTCVWTKYAMYYYLDGVLVDITQNIRPDNSVPAYIVYSTYQAVKDSWYGIMHDEDYGVTMNVDWVRVYK